MEPKNQFTETAMISVLVNNDFHYMHFKSLGEDFDKSHNLAQEYYEKIDDEVDYLMELAMEVGQPIYNFTRAHDIVPEYSIENKDSYDYPTIISCLQNKIGIYINSLKNLRNSTNNSSIQSRLDDIIRDWEKELNYRLTRRVNVTPSSSFINTGLDNMVANLSLNN